jgi:uncharacterized protein (DUF1800 family)
MKPTVLALLILAAGPVAAQRAQPDGIPAKPDARTISHVLNRLGYGPRPGDVERIQQIGLAKYIDDQLHPERIPDADLADRLKHFETLKLTAKELTTEYMQPAQQMQQEMRKDPKNLDANGQLDPKAIQQNQKLREARQRAQAADIELTDAKLLRAIASERQLNEVLVDFWFNHFNVYQNKGQVRNYLIDYERDVIRPNVLGKFRDLLGATAHSSAMLFYLDNWQSQDPHAQERQMEAQLRGARNPQQRAQMQMRLEQQKKGGARGLNENYGRELMELHTLGVDGGYTQQDVIEVARALTGWTIDTPQQGGAFIFRPPWHDTGEKTILGVKFPAGHGQDEGEHVLDILAKHPSTAHHIAFQLAQRFVADEPPKALVDRAAKRFLETDGDLREVTRLIITSPEFFAAGTYRAKMKTPLDFVVSAVRAASSQVDDAAVLIQQLRNNLGMPLYQCQPPTGYSNTADAWVNTGALLSRMNFAVSLVSNQLRGIRVDVMSIAPDTTDATRTRLVAQMLAGDVSDATRQTLGRAQAPLQIIALTLGAPEFQRR